MKTLLALLMAASLAGSLYVPSADAARVGGGRSVGIQRSVTPPPRTAPQQQAAPAAAPAAPEPPKAPAARIPDRTKEQNVELGRKHRTALELYQALKLEAGGGSTLTPATMRARMRAGRRSGGSGAADVILSPVLA